MKRYCQELCSGHWDQDPEGEWVKFKDVVALVAELKEETSYWDNDETIKLLEEKLNE